MMFSVISVHFTSESLNAKCYARITEHAIMAMWWGKPSIGDNLNIRDTTLKAPVDPLFGNILRWKLLFRLSTILLIRESDEKDGRS